MSDLTRVLTVPKEQDTALAISSDQSGDFISAYADYADVFEIPRAAHEWVGTQMIASALNGRVMIEWGGTVPLDLWLMLLSGSGQGRNTTTNVARRILDAASLTEGFLRNASWGSRVAVYQQIAESPRGLYIWPELSVVMRKLNDRAFSGVKEWLTDCYDSPVIPSSVTYRRTGKNSDTPPIVFTEAPRLNILATSSHDWFTNNLEEADATGGFIPRWLPIRLDGSTRLIPKPLPFDNRLVRPLADQLAAIAKLEGQADLCDVEEDYGVWYRKTKARFQAQPNEALADAFFNRLRIHVVKLAVIFEVSQSCSLKVSERAMRRAIEAARKIEATIFALLPTGMNREGSEVEKMAERVRRAGPAGMLRSQLTLAFSHWKRQDREGRLRTLTESQTVCSFCRGTVGRSATVYVHQDHLEAHAKQHSADRPID